MLERDSANSTDSKTENTPRIYPDLHDSRDVTKKLHDAILTRYENLINTKETDSHYSPELLQAFSKYYENRQKSSADGPLKFSSPLTALNELELTLLKSEFLEVEFQEIFSRCGSMDRKIEDSVNRMLSNRQKSALQNARVKADQELYREIKALKRIVKKRPGNQKENENLYAAVDRFNEKYLSEENPCYGLITLTPRDFDELEKKFQGENYNLVFEYYRKYNRKNAESIAKAKLEYEVALTKLEEYLNNEDNKKRFDIPGNIDIQSRLYMQGKEVFKAIKDAPKKETLDEYRFLRNLLLDTRVGIETPIDDDNRKRYKKHVARANGDISIGKVLYGVLQIFASMLTAACALLSFAVIPTIPIALIPAAAYVFGTGLLVRSGVLNIQKEIKSKKADEIKTVGFKCKLFLNEWEKKNPKPSLPSLPSRVGPARSA